MVKAGVWKRSGDAGALALVCGFGCDLCRGGSGINLAGLCGAGTLPGEKLLTAQGAKRTAKVAKKYWGRSETPHLRTDSRAIICASVYLCLRFRVGELL